MGAGTGAAVALAAFAVAAVMTSPGTTVPQGAAHSVTGPIPSSTGGRNGHGSGTPGPQGTPSSPNSRTSPDDRFPRSGDQTPVGQALADLAAEPAVRYSGYSPDGRSAWEMTVTAGGAAQGELDVGDARLGVLQVGGRTYFEADDAAALDVLARLTAGPVVSSLRGRWVTGVGAATAMVPAGLASPAELADSLRSAVGASPSPRQNTDATGVVTTSAGVLHISTTKPYRILRLESGSASAAEPGGPTEVETVSPAAARQFLADLVDQTKALTDAVDVGIAVSSDQDPELTCSVRLCTVTAHDVVASSVVAAASPDGARADSVLVTMTAQVTVMDQPVGTCGTSAALPLDRPVALSCQDPDIAAALRSLGSGASSAVAVAIRFEVQADTQADVDGYLAAEQNQTAAGNLTS